MHYALCTMHCETLVGSRMIWKTAAISPRFQHPLNSATPLCERDRPSLSSSHTYKETLCPISLFGGNPKDIFSLFLFPHLQSPLLSRSHFLEHFLPPKDNFPHVSRSRVSPNPTFWINNPKDIFSTRPFSSPHNTSHTYKALV